MDIGQLARDIAERFDADEDAARKTAEIYLTQIERVDEKTIDRNHIPAEDAEVVIEAFAAGRETSGGDDDRLADELIELSDRIRDAQEHLDMMTGRRNELINRLLDRAVSVRDISEWSGLTRGRIYAIRLATQ